ncbi:MAG: aminotransferase class III-fold pyridoxal phosphate-dependent enzyme [Kiritimatiellaeota bacterium]|nr:aminotransferase class III-fold pyridoxal phosphate-dependent enzyme [Kiritimatiellota bacterium]
MSALSHNLQWRERSLKVMPFGSSTCSKAPQYPPDEPSVIVRGKGCRVWDADGREFIDFRNSLGPVTLGYAFPDTDAAIRAQLDDGIVFGHPHPLECEVAETLCEIIPCAEKARFLKTGGEAAAACFRLARACTGREHIVQIGYNGWLNSLAVGARVLPAEPGRCAPSGVPACLSALHHAAAWNDRAGLEALFQALDGRIAAVAVAASYADMRAGHDFFPFLREITRRNGALLIFDEIVTGFRIALAGVQEYFGVTPDLAVFAKGVANGMPLSVYTGAAGVMDACRPDGVIISSTYGGETLSLAAARATLRVYREQGVIQHLWRQGERMWSGLNGLFETHGLPMEMVGMWPCPQLVVRGDGPAQLRERFLRAAFRHGVSLYNVSYVNFSHSATDVDEALDRLNTALADL